MTRVVVIVLAGVGCYFAATSGATQVAIGAAVLGVLVLVHLVLTDRDLVLHILRRSLMVGAAFTAVMVAISIHRDHVAGVALYGLLLVLCGVGLMVRPADERPA